MDKFDSRRDIEQFVSHRLPLETRLYDMTEQEMIRYATNEIIDRMHDHKLRLGMWLPEKWFQSFFGHDGKKWWELFV